MKARITDAFATITENIFGEHVARNWLSIRRSPCNKRSTCWSVLMCFKKTFCVTFRKKKICLYYMYSSFLVINFCNQRRPYAHPIFGLNVRLKEDRVLEWRTLGCKDICKFYTHILESTYDILNRVPTNTNVTEIGISNHFPTSVNWLQRWTLHRHW